MIAVWFYRTLNKIPWTGHISNEEVLKRGGGSKDTNLHSGDMKKEVPENSSLTEHTEVRGKWLVTSLMRFDGQKDSKKLNVT